MKKFITALLISALAIVSLTGCFGTSLDAKALLQGNLDALYLDQTTDSYLKLVDSTADECHQNYEDGVWVEVDYAAQYFDISLDDCDESIKTRMFDTLCEIYTHSKFEVGDSTKSNDSYLIEVTIYPIDIFDKVVNEDFQTAYDESWATRDFTNMTDQEFETAWAEFILDLIDARMATIDYLEPETFYAEIAKDSNNYYSITDKSGSEIDTYIIAYP